jgi:hypothetical protein
LGSYQSLVGFWTEKINEIARARQQKAEPRAGGTDPSTAFAGILRRHSRFFKAF